MTEPTAAHREDRGIHYRLADFAHALTTRKLILLVNQLRQRMRPVDAHSSSSDRWTAWSAFATEYRQRCIQRASQTPDRELAARIGARISANAAATDPATAISHTADEDEFYLRHPAAGRAADTALTASGQASSDRWGWHKRLLVEAGYQPARAGHAGQHVNRGSRSLAS
jgi:hypothetical protein